METTTYIGTVLVCNIISVLQINAISPSSVFKQPSCGYGYVLPEGVTVNSTARHVVDCARQCYKDDVCVAFNACQVDGEGDIRCELSDIRSNETCSILEQRGQCQLLEMENPCLNGGSFAGRKCFCTEGFAGDLCQRFIRDCTEGYLLGYKTTKYYQIQPLGYGSWSHAYCDMMVGSTELLFMFSWDPVGHNWLEYRNEFGDQNGAHWLGNENLYQILQQGTYFLRIVIRFSNTGDLAGATYTDFRLGNESSGYPIFFDSYINSTDPDFAGAIDKALPNIFCSENTSLSLNGQEFSTLDQGPESVRAATSQSGWWFKEECLTDLTGGTPTSYISNGGVNDALAVRYMSVVNVAYTD